MSIFLKILSVLLATLSAAYISLQWRRAREKWDVLHHGAVYCAMVVTGILGLGGSIILMVASFSQLTGPMS